MLFHSVVVNSSYSIFRLFILLVIGGSALLIKAKLRVLVWERRKESLVHTVCAYVPSSVGNLHTTPLMVNFCSPAERSHCIVILPHETHMGDFEVRNNIALMATVLIASF